MIDRIREVRAQELIKTPVNDVMSSNVVFVPDGQPLEFAARTLTDSNLSAVFVGSPDELHGMLTMQNVSAKLTAQSVTEAMTQKSDVVALKSGGTIGDAYALMNSKGVNVAPVVSNKRIVGVVTRQGLERKLFG